jgi:hypothetical protein
MRNKTPLILLCFALMSSALFGVIIETPHFSQIQKHVTPNTLVVLDIDDTLLLPTQTLGTDVWFQYRVKQNVAKGYPQSEAFEKASAEWEAVRHLTQVKLVEQGTDKIVADLQNKRITVMGLTTQGLALGTRTVQQLQSLNIDLSKTAPSSQDFYFSICHGVLYRKGILFTAGAPKGESLLKLLDAVGYQPTHILFINDKETHLKDVEKAVIAKGLAFTGLRYSYCDQRVAAFSGEIADIQWKHSTFEHILSDEEAVDMQTDCANVKNDKVELTGVSH